MGRFFDQLLQEAAAITGTLAETGTELLKKGKTELKSKISDEDAQRAKDAGRKIGAAVGEQLGNLFEVASQGLRDFEAACREEEHPEPSTVETATPEVVAETKASAPIAPPAAKPARKRPAGKRSPKQ
jgi:hypothetical protein